MTEVKVGTWNVGDGSNDRKQHDLEHLFAQSLDALAMQEAGDRGQLLATLAARPELALYDGDGRPGATSTPLLWRADLWRARRRWTVSLSSRFWAPEGVGPNWVKPKVLNLVELENRETHEVIVVCSTHEPASLWARLRALLGRGITRKVARATEDIEHPVYVCADWNAKVGARILRPLRQALNSAQATKGPLPTHGKRAIDDVWTRGVRVTEAATVQTSSDHRALVVTSSLPDRHGHAA